MKIEIYVKGNSTHLQVPAERTVSWLLEAAQLWAHEVKGLPTRMGKCEARRLGGEVLDPKAKLGQTLKEGESVYVFLPEDITFMSMGR